MKQFWVAENWVLTKLERERHFLTGDYSTCLNFGPCPSVHWAFDLLISIIIFFLFSFWKVLQARILLWSPNIKLELSSCSVLQISEVVVSLAFSAKGWKFKCLVCCHIKPLSLCGLSPNGKRMLTKSFSAVNWTQVLWEPGRTLGSTVQFFIMCIPVQERVSQVCVYFSL